MSFYLVVYLCGSLPPVVSGFPESEDVKSLLPFPSPFLVSLYPKGWEGKRGVFNYQSVFRNQRWSVVLQCRYTEDDLLEHR